MVVSFTTANTTVCRPLLFLARVRSFVVCFVCRGEGNNRKTMVSILKANHIQVCVMFWHS